MRTLLTVLTATVALSSLPALADECHFYAAAGSRANHATADCTPSGDQETCAKNGKTLAEFHLKGGKRNGPGWYLDGNDRKLAYTYKDGLANGPGKVFDKDGSLLCEMQFVDDKAEGLVRESAKGKVKGVYLYKKGDNTEARLTFTKGGHLSAITCGEQSFAPEDKEYCGWGGKTQNVTLYNDREEPSAFGMVLRDGKMISQTGKDGHGKKYVKTFPHPGNKRDYDMTVSFDDGKPYRTFSMRDEKEDGAFVEFAPTGQKVEDSRYDASGQAEKTTFYLNGNPKEKLKLSGATTVTFQRFWDSGKLQEEGAYVVEAARKRHPEFDRWGLYHRTGPYQSFYESGKPREQGAFVDGKEEGPYKIFYENGVLADDEVYKAGTLTHLRHFNDKGTLEKDEEYFPDGSRKLNK